MFMVIYVYMKNLSSSVVYPFDTLCVLLACICGQSSSHVWVKHFFQNVYQLSDLREKIQNIRKRKIRLRCLNIYCCVSRLSSVHNMQ